LIEETKTALGGRISRRLVLRRAAMLGLSAPVVGALLAACGGNDNTPTAGTSSATMTTATTPSTGTTGAGTAASPATTTGTTAANWKPRDLKANITGSGSSFVDPAMQSWIKQYKTLAPNVTINYQSVGSGQGKKDFIGGVTSFAGTDAYMTDDESKQLTAFNIPVVIGAVTVLYNLKGLDKLQFSGETLANIFLGKITTWDDKAIAADNPGVKLPGDPVTVVYRSDGSGTTAIFTNYLSKVSADWKSQVGEGTSVRWPVGIGAEKSPGVTAAVQQTPGAISYVELIYALSNKLPTPAVKNAAGSFVVPSLQAASDAAAGFLSDLPADLRVFITNPKQGSNAYPITGFSWLLVRADYQDATIGQAVADFVYWCYTAGQKISQDLQYAPVPEQVQTAATKLLAQVKAGGQPAISL
jgi:phosphate transport system substrate-binding protein